MRHALARVVASSAAAVAAAPPANPSSHATRRFRRWPLTSLRGSARLVFSLPPGIAVELDFCRLGISRKWILRGSNAFALVSAAVCLYSMRRADPDVWGHLTYGRLFVEQGGLPSDDPFAYTSMGLEWIHSEYIAQITLWLAYHYGGPLGLIALKCVVGGVALYFLFVALRTTTDEPYFWLPLFLLCASPVSRFFLFRPQLFTYAFFALFVVVLFGFLLRRRAHLWILPIVMLVWANAHGGFVAGLGAIGLAILLRASENVTTGPFRLRRILDGTAALWMALVACVGATLINPIGWRLWAYLFTELTNSTNRENIVEWVRPACRWTRGRRSRSRHHHCHVCPHGMVCSRSQRFRQRCTASVLGAQLPTAARDGVGIGSPPAAGRDLDRTRHRTAGRECERERSICV